MEVGELVVDEVVGEADAEGEELEGVLGEDGDVLFAEAVAEGDLGGSVGAAPDTAREVAEEVGRSRSGGGGGGEGERKWRGGSKRRR